MAEEKNRFIIHALNESGYNGTNVDLLDLLHHVKNNMTEIWDSIDSNSILVEHY